MKKVIMLIFCLQFFATYAQGTKYYWVDEDNKTKLRAKNGNETTFKKGDLLVVINDTIFWGNDTIAYKNNNTETVVKEFDPKYKDLRDSIIVFRDTSNMQLLIFNKLNDSFFNVYLSESSEFLRKGLNHFPIGNLSKLEISWKQEITRNTNNESKTDIGTVYEFIDIEHCKLIISDTSLLNRKIIKKDTLYLIGDDTLLLSSDSIYYYAITKDDNLYIFSKDEVVSKQYPPEYKTNLQFFKELRWWWQLLIGLGVLGVLMGIAFLTYKLLLKPKDKKIKRPNYRYKFLGFVKNAEQKQACFLIPYKNDDEFNSLKKILKKENDKDFQCDLYKKYANWYVVSVNLRLESKKEDELRNIWKNDNKIIKQVKKQKQKCKNKKNYQYYIPILNFQNFQTLCIEQYDNIYPDTEEENKKTESQNEDIDLINSEGDNSYRPIDNGTSTSNKVIVKIPIIATEKEINYTELIQQLNDNIKKMNEVQTLLFNEEKKLDEKKAKQTEPSDGEEFSNFSTEEDLLAELRLKIEELKKKIKEIIKEINNRFSELEQEKKELTNQNEALKSQNLTNISNNEEITALNEKISTLKNEYEEKKQNAISEVTEKLQQQLNEKEAKILTANKSKQDTLVAAKEEKRKAIEKVENEKKAELTKKEGKITELKDEVNKIAKKKDDEYAGKIKVKDEEIAKIKKENTEAITKKETEIMQVKQERQIALDTKEKEWISKTKRYHETTFFVDGLREYSKIVLKLLEKSAAWQKEASKTYMRLSITGNTQVENYYANVLSKFLNEISVLKVGEWREQLKYIIEKGAIIIDDSDSFKFIKQFKDKSEKEQSEEFEKNLYYDLLKNYCSAMLALVESSIFLSTYSIGKLEKFYEARKELRSMIKNDLKFEINDAQVLESAKDKYGIRIAKEVELNCQSGMIVEIISYGIAMKNTKLEPTQVITNK